MTCPIILLNYFKISKWILIRESIQLTTGSNQVELRKNLLFLKVG